MVVPQELLPCILASLYRFCSDQIQTKYTLTYHVDLMAIEETQNIVYA